MLAYSLLSREKIRPQRLSTRGRETTCLPRLVCLFALPRMLVCSCLNAGSMCLIIILPLLPLLPHATLSTFNSLAEEKGQNRRNHELPHQHHFYKFECKNEQNDTKNRANESIITYYYVIYYYYNILIINILTPSLQPSCLKNPLNVACGMWHVAKLVFWGLFSLFWFIAFCFILAKYYLVYRHVFSKCGKTYL